MLANPAKKTKDSDERYLLKSSKLNDLQTLYALSQCYSTNLNGQCSVILLHHPIMLPRICKYSSTTHFDPTYLYRTYSGATLRMATPSNPISSSYSPPYQITPPTTTDSTTTQSLDKTPRNLSLEFSALSIMYPKCKRQLSSISVGEAIYDLVPFVIPTPRSSLCVHRT
ncbi:hypothetical protein ACSQ67_009151 [Phaseolus vulgaris]